MASSSRAGRVISPGSAAGASKRVERGFGRFGGRLQAAAKLLGAIGGVHSLSFC